MRSRLLVSLLVAVFSLSTWSAASACPGMKNNKSRAKTVPKSAATVVLALQSMSCKGCSKRVANALRKVKGVYTAQVDFAKGRAVIKYGPKRTSVAKIVKIVQKLGYTVKMPVS